MLKEGAKYGWKDDAVFSMTKDQFGAIHNGLSAIVTSPAYQEELRKAQQTMEILKLHQTMNEVLDAAVVAGVAVEITDTLPAEG